MWQKMIDRLKNPNDLRAIRAAWRIWEATAEREGWLWSQLTEKQQKQLLLGKIPINKKEKNHEKASSFRPIQKIPD